MKMRLFLIGLLVFLTAQYAVAYDYSLTYEPQRDNGDYGYGLKMLLSTKPGATDGFDSEALISSVPAKDIYFALHNIQGVTPGWNGDTGFYWTDYRLPLEAGETRSIDNLYLWAVPGTTGQNLVIGLCGGMSEGLSYKLTLVSIPAGINYSGTRVWDQNNNQLIVLPMYTASDGLTGYHFQAQFTAVPEPSSILALIRGIAGLGGLVLGRKRK